MTTPDFRRRYVEALRQHVLHRDEATLRDGYELGRRAVAEGSSALELAAIHHDALVPSLVSAPQDRASEVVAAAAAFFQEILSAFEMVHRGYREAAAAAAAERRAAMMLRRLSSFLADTSLSAQRADTAAEALHLVAEHGRELTGARHSCASWRGAGQHLSARASDSTATVEDDRILEHLERVAHELPTRVSRADWTREPALRPLAPGSNVLTAPITTLDGINVGLLQLVDKRQGDFSDVDEAVAVHIANMTAAAFERSQMYDAPIPH